MAIPPLPALPTLPNRQEKDRQRGKTWNGETRRGLTAAAIDYRWPSKAAVDQFRSDFGSLISFDNGKVCAEALPFYCASTVFLLRRNTPKLTVPPQVCAEAAELLTSMLHPDPSKRPTAKDLLRNGWLLDGQPPSVDDLPDEPDAAVELSLVLAAGQSEHDADSGVEPELVADPESPSALLGKNASSGSEGTIPDPYDGGRYSDAFVGTFGKAPVIRYKSRHLIPFTRFSEFMENVGFVSASAQQLVHGLGMMIGPRQPGNPFPQMRAEHCEVMTGIFGRSDESFSSSPNHQDSTPAKEWQHVFDPMTAASLSAGVDIVSGELLGDRLKTRWQDIVENAVKLINASFADARWSHVVTQLQLDALGLEDSEVVAMRLYTGPMFEVHTHTAASNGSQSGDHLCLRANRCTTSVCGQWARRIIWTPRDPTTTQPGRCRQGGWCGASS